TTPSAKFDVPQYKYDADTGSINSNNREIALDVDVPPCFMQVDLVWGAEILDSIVEGGPRYGKRILGSNGAPGNQSKGPWGGYNGGRATCGSKPSVEFESTCDEVVVTLANEGTLPAVFSAERKIG